MQIKTTVKHHLTLVRMSINKSTNNSASKDVEKGEPLCTVGGMQIGVAIVESNMGKPQKLKMELPFDPSIPLLGLYLKEPKTLI